MKVSRHPHRTRILVVLVFISMFMLGIASAITVQSQQAKRVRTVEPTSMVPLAVPETGVAEVVLTETAEGIGD